MADTRLELEPEPYALKADAAARFIGVSKSTLYTLPIPFSEPNGPDGDRVYRVSDLKMHIDLRITRPGAKRPRNKKRAAA